MDRQIHRVVVRSLVAGLGVFCLAAGTHAQVTFHEGVGTQGVDQGQSITRAPSGGVAVVGTRAASSTAPGRILLQGFDDCGVTTFERLISVTTGSNDRGTSVEALRDGGLLIGAETSANIQGGSAVVIRLTPALTVAWARAIRGSSFIDLPAGVVAKEATDGSIYAISRQVNTVDNLTEGVVTRLTPAGALISQARFRVGVIGAADASTTFLDLDRAPDASGVVISGSFRATPNSPPRPLVVRLDTALNVVWARSLQGLQGSSEAVAVRVTSDQTGVGVVGTGISPAGAPGGIAWRLDPAGNLGWFASLGSFVPSVHGMDVEPRLLTPTGIITDLTSGRTRGAAAHIDDAGGGLLRVDAFGDTSGNVVAADVLVLPSPTIGPSPMYLTGATTMLASLGQTDLWLARTDAQGSAGCRSAPFRQIIPLTDVGPLVLQMIRRVDELVIPIQPSIIQTQSGRVVYCQNCCVADYNGDGLLNTDDLSDFITDYFTSPPVPGPGGYAVTPCPLAPAPYNALGYKVDFNGDCLVNSDDLSDFITAYYQGC